MRAARTAQVWQWPARHAVPGQDAGTPAHTAGPRAGASLGLRPVLGLAALFLAGYVITSMLTASVAAQYTVAGAGFVLGIVFAIFYDRWLRARGGLSFNIVRLF